jgi:hypothetical protein
MIRKVDARFSGPALGRGGLGLAITCRSSHDFHIEPALVGATPFWLAARFSEPGVRRPLMKHGADPLFVHRSDEVSESKGFNTRPK